MKLIELSLEELNLLCSLLDLHIENLEEYDLEGIDKEMVSEKGLVETLALKLKNALSNADDSRDF